MKLFGLIIGWRMFRRSLFYFRQGYAHYLQLPASLISYCVSIYYLAVQNIPFLYALFPSFTSFILVAVILMYFLGGLFGFLHFKGFLKSLYVAEQDVTVESNIYLSEVLNPNTLIQAKVLYDLALKQGIPCTELGELIRRSEEKNSYKL